MPLYIVLQEWIYYLKTIFKERAEKRITFLDLERKNGSLFWIWSGEMDHFFGFTMAGDRISKREIFNRKFTASRERESIKGKMLSGEVFWG